MEEIFLSKSKDPAPDLLIVDMLRMEDYQRQLVVYLNDMNYNRKNYHKEHYKKSWILTEIKDVTKWLKIQTN